MAERIRASIRATWVNVLSAIARERDHQDRKHGPIDTHPHGIVEWMLIMRNEIAEAEQAWTKKGEAEALKEILQVVATGFACLEQHGVVERTE
jgi:hypothetical protein